MTPSQRFRVEAILPVIDKFIASLRQRIAAYEQLSSLFGFLTNLEEMSVDEIDIAAQKIIEQYKDDIGIELKGELFQFSKFVVLFKDEEDKSVSKVLYLYRMLHEKNVIDTFPNIEIMLRIYMSMMVTNS